MMKRLTKLIVIIILLGLISCNRYIPCPAYAGVQQSKTKAVRK